MGCTMAKTRMNSSRMATATVNLFLKKVLNTDFQ